MKNLSSNLALTGRIKLGVIQGGVRRDLTGWIKNLLLDQGMNNLATIPLVGLFDWAAKGSGSTATRELIDTSNTYSRSGGTLTRNTSPATPRNFTSADVGKLMAFNGGGRLIITAYTSATVVSVRAVGTDALPTILNEEATLYSVQQVGLDSEEGDRTNTYLEGSTSDDTTTGIRTISRTFIFGAEPENKETPAGTNTYSWSGTVVTRTGGARNFTSADEGKYIQFITGGEYVQLIYDAGNTSNQMATAAAPVGTPSGNVYFYGYNEYGEIGFSDLEAAGDNLNIRVRLETSGGVASPVLVLGDNPANAPGYLTVTYEITVAMSPATTQTGLAPISDPAFAMSVNKSADWVIEDMDELTGTNTDGSTDSAGTSLEPSNAAVMGISTDSVPLVPLDGPVRASNIASVNMTNDAYVADSFTITSQGSFGLAQANGTAWRSLGIYNPNTGRFPFIFLFDVNQTKDVSHSLQVTWRKSWDRTLPCVAP